MIERNINLSEQMRIEIRKTATEQGPSKTILRDRIECPINQGRFEKFMMGMDIMLPEAIVGCLGWP